MTNNYLLFTVRRTMWKVLVILVQLATSTEPRQHCKPWPPHKLLPKLDLNKAHCWKRSLQAGVDGCW